MRTAKKNIIIGTTFVDIKGFPDSEYIERGRNAGTIEYVQGGVGRNIAENLGRCACQTVFVSAVDQSSLAADIIDRLQREGVETKYIARSEAGLGTWLAIFDNEGDVVASISKRADMHGILPVMAEHETEIFSDASGLSVEMDMDPDIVAKIMDYARKYDLPVYAVLSNMKIALEHRAFDYPISCLVCNQQEAEMMFTSLGHGVEGIIQSVKEGVSSYPVEKMVVTLGSEGAVYYDRTDDSAGWIPPVAVEVCDTTGAGDAFFSGVVIGLTRGDSLEEACKTGALLASSVISTRENVCGHLM